MVFSDTTDLTGLVQDIDFLVGTNATSYPVKDKARNINQWYHRAVGWIVEADGTWKWDDTTHAEWPSAAGNLTAGTNEYALPASSTSATQIELLKVQSVYILKADGDYVKLRQLVYEDIPNIEEYESTDGLPHSYLLVGDRVRLFPGPAAASVTTTNGLKVYFQRAVDDFTSADTSQEPAIAPQFHRILSFGASLDYAVKQGLPNVNNLRGEIARLSQDLQTFYSERNLDSKIKIRPKELARRHRL